MVRTSHFDDHVSNNSDTLTPERCESLGGILTGSGCTTPVYVADVFLFSCLLFIGTFAVAVALKTMRNSSFFPSKVS